LSLICGVITVSYIYQHWDLAEPDVGGLVALLVKPNHRLHDVLAVKPDPFSTIRMRKYSLIESEYLQARPIKRPRCQPIG
jgi:hypothetical protein